MSVTRILRHTTARTQSTVLFVLPHGGQNLARRNAWASMSVDATRARARREAAAAVTYANAQHRVAATG